jgi:two-component system, OmpR family, sensor kinase
VIRRRLVLIVVVLVAVVFTVSGVAFLATLRSRMVDNIDERLLVMPEFINVQAAIDLQRQLRPGQIDIDFRQMAFVRLDPAGKIVGSLPSGPPDHPDPLPDVSGLDTPVGPLTVDAVDGKGPRYRLVTSKLPAGGTLVTAVPLDDVDDTVADARQILFIAGAVALVAVAVAGWWAIRVGLRPVDRMVDTAQRIADGNITERLDVADPNSEMGKLSSALNQMLDRLEEAFAARTASEDRMRQFIADASHELRTPLTAIRGYAELYATSDDPGERATAMGRVKTAAVRMAGLVDDLVLLARLDQGRPLATEPVDVARLVTDAAADARAISPDRLVDVQTPLDGTTVVGDPARLRQVIDNLLSNVREHTPPGTRVGVSVAVEGDEVLVRVGDDGPGMTEEEAARAFDRFWQAPATDAHPRRGTGLGLAIVADLVRAHGGTIALQSAPGVGTLVTIRIPRQTAEQDSQEAPSYV